MDNKNCQACGKPAKVSILLAGGGDWGRWYLPNQNVRECANTGGIELQKELLKEVWFCSVCMRKLEDNLNDLIQNPHGQ